MEKMRFDRNKLRFLPLDQRVHDLDLGAVMPLEAVVCREPSLRTVAKRIRSAREMGSEVIMMMGGHVIRSGVQRFIIDMMEEGLLSCLAMNGSCVIHDFEFALIGATTESVSRYISEGQFGLWKETGRINDIVNDAYRTGGDGMGAAVGRAIYEGEFPHKDISLLAAGYRLGVPVTVHVAIGQDIIHEHPNFDGASTGATSYLDFLALADVVTRLDGGVVMNFGSSVMAPEVFLKALAMARNTARQEGAEIKKFTTLVCDLLDLPGSFREEAPRQSSGYYFRPWKTMLVRTVADGGESHYVKGRHAETVPALWSALKEEAQE